MCCSFISIDDCYIKNSLVVFILNMDSKINHIFNLNLFIYISFFFLNIILLIMLRASIYNGSNICRRVYHKNNLCVYFKVYPLLYL